MSRLSSFASLAVLSGLLTCGVAGGEESAVFPPPCRWTRPKTEHVVTVDSSASLVRAVRTAAPGTTILLEDGDYRLAHMLDLTAPGLVLAGKSGDRDKVVLRGAGMNKGAPGVAISVSASRVTIADLTVGYVRFHGIQIRGEKGVSDVVVQNVRVVDTGQQLIKGSIGRDSQRSRNCSVSCSLLEYTDGAPSDYTDGIDVLGGEGWVVRGNRFVRIRGPEQGGRPAGPAVLFWRNSKDTLVEQNLILDSSRGIALGLVRPGPGRTADHEGGVIRNNVIVNLNSWADEGIEVNSGMNVRVEHNTVFTTGENPWSISFRFPETKGMARNNLTNRRIIFRDGAAAELEGNVTTAEREWFADLARGDVCRVDRGDAAAGLDHDLACPPRAMP
jgi:hypothetical protein